MGGLSLMVDEPPATIHDEVAERALLGAILLSEPGSQDRVERTIGSLSPEVFFSERHRVTWRAIEACQAEGESVDVVTVGNRLAGAGELERAGGYLYLTQLIDEVPHSDNLSSHAGIVREMAHRRDIARIGTLAARECSTGGGTASEIRENLLRSLEAVRVSSSGPPGRSALEILNDPDAAQPAPPVLSPLAWGGKLTVFSAREKAGKTTTLASGVAAITAGHAWLNASPAAATVVWWSGAQESAPADVARIVRDFGGALGRLFFLEERGEPFGLIQRGIEAWSPAVVVVDSLASLVQDLDLDPGNSSQWTPVMGRLSRMAKDSGTAFVVVHHGRKEDGKYRDSTAIGAGADLLVSLSGGPDDPQKEEDDGIRKMTAVGRWRVEPVTFRMVEPENGPPRMELSDGTAPLESRILLFVAAHPGCSLRDLRGGVQGRASEVSTTVTRLVNRGHLEDRGSGNARKLHLSQQGNPHGTGPEPVGNRSGTTFPGEREGGGSQGGHTPRRGVPPGTAPQPPASEDEVRRAAGGGE